MEYNFEEVKEFLKKKKLWGEQCFNTRNTVGDPIKNVYEKDGVSIDVCSYYGYYEIFGLDEDDFLELEKAYEDKYDYLFKDSESEA